MRKLFLITGSFFGGIIIFLLFILIFIKPDHLKPLITAQFEKYTGYQLAIDDHLSFSFFPYWGVKANHIRIIAPNDSPFPALKIDIENAILELNILSLLHGRLKTGAIQINQLTLDQKDMPSTISFHNIRFKSSTNQTDDSFPINLSFYFDEKSLALTGKAVISGNIHIDWKNDYYFIENTICNVFVTNQDKTLHLSTSGDIIVDVARQTAAWKKFNVNANDLNINGELNATDILNDPDVRGLFSLSHIDSFLISKNDISNIEFGLHFKKNILNIESIKADLYGGLLNGEGMINLESLVPIATAHVKTRNIQIEPLFKLLQAMNTDISPNTKIFGTGNIELDVSTKGSDEKSLLNNLNGSGYMNIVNGIFMGPDWDEMLKQWTVNNAVTQEMISQNFRVFRFKQLSGSFKINNGIFSNDDLLIESFAAIIKGKGDINFPNNFIDYKLQAEFQNILPHEGLNDFAKNSTPTLFFRESLN